MDICDLAQERMEVEFERALKRARTPPTPLVPNGECHFCGERTAGNFCGTACRDDYDRRRAALGRLGT